MTTLFLGFLNRSLSAAVLIFAVVLVRLVFKKAPKWLRCALWALAAVRLVCTNWVPVVKKWHPIVFIGISALVGVLLKF